MSHGLELEHQDTNLGLNMVGENKLTPMSLKGIAQNVPRREHSFHSRE